MCSCTELAAFIGQLRHSELFACHQGWSLEVVCQYQYSSTCTSFNTRQGGDHEGRHGPPCDLIIHEVIFTGSTNKDIQLRFHEFSSSVRRQGYNVMLEDTLIKSSRRGMYLHTYFRNWVCKRYVFTSKVCKIASTAMFTLDLKPKKLRIP